MKIISYTIIILVMGVAGKVYAVRAMSVDNRTPWHIYVEFENSTAVTNSCYFHFDSYIPANSYVPAGTEPGFCDVACYSYVLIQIHNNPNRFRFRIPTGFGNRRECGDQSVELDYVMEKDSKTLQPTGWYIILVEVSLVNENAYRTYGFKYNPTTNTTIECSYCRYTDALSDVKKNLENKMNTPMIDWTTIK